MAPTASNPSARPPLDSSRPRAHRSNASVARPGQPPPLSLFLTSSIASSLGSPTAAVHGTSYAVLRAPAPAHYRGIVGGPPSSSSSSPSHSHSLLTHNAAAGGSSGAGDSRAAARSGGAAAASIRGSGPTTTNMVVVNGVPRRAPESRRRAASDFVAGRSSVSSSGPAGASFPDGMVRVAPKSPPRRASQPPPSSSTATYEQARISERATTDPALLPHAPPSLSISDATTGIGTAASEHHQPPRREPIRGPLVMTLPDPTHWPRQRPLKTALVAPGSPSRWSAARKVLSSPVASLTPTLLRRTALPPPAASLPSPSLSSVVVVQGSRGSHASLPSPALAAAPDLPGVAAVREPAARHLPPPSATSPALMAAALAAAPPSPTAALVTVSASSAVSGIGGALRESLSAMIGGAGKSAAEQRPLVAITLSSIARDGVPMGDNVAAFRGPTALAPVGLSNVGNTCFMAAALQCLASVDMLTNYVLAPDGAAKDLNPFSDNKGVVVRAYARLLSEMAATKVGGAVNPRAFKREVERIAPQFEGYDQQDAQEFLRCLLDGLSTDLYRARYLARFSIPEADEDALPPEAKATVAWARYAHTQASFVSDVFAGQLMSRVRCHACGGVFSSFDVFWDLSVPIPTASRSYPSAADSGYDGAGAVPLAECLREYAREEELDQNEWYNCPTCKSRQRTSKQMLVHRLPPLLVIHLKRFASLRHKLTAPVSFPLEGLDLSSICTGTEPTPKYRLVGVLEHSGSLSFGHYVASVYRNGAWYHMNDGSVSRISDPAREAHGEWAMSAYVLFFQQQQQPLSLPLQAVSSAASTTSSSSGIMEPRTDR
ncbi:hypothetical protein BC828DRAFT_390577 [Blastocladiella britannica]|nr:hypothetical protein BC828DRAFT_390577 [Blastocladiella britannica]